MKPGILINANFYGVGGRETHLVKLSESLVQAGAEVTIATRVATSSSKQIIEALQAVPVRFISTPFSANSNSLKLSTLWAMAVWPLHLRRQSFDALYTFDLSAFTRFLKRFVSSQGKVFLNRAGDLMREEDRPTGDLPKADAIIVESELQAAAVRKVCPAGLKIIALPLLGHYQSPPRRLTSNRNGFLKAVFLGRYDENKGAFRLLQLWPQLHDRQLKLSFHGHGDRLRLQKLIDSNGLASRVEINQGWKSADELAAILEQTDFVVLPSQTEGLPVVLLEAIAHGVPFVATDVGAIRTLAENNPDVIVVANDLDSIRAGIDEMANSIRSGVIEGKRLQQFAVEKYGYDRLSDLWQQTLIDRVEERSKVNQMNDIARGEVRAVTR